MDAQGSVEKAIDVLFHLHAEPTPCGVSEIGRALDMPKSSVHRLLASLVRRRLVERDDHGRYRPGVSLVALGLGVLEREPSVMAARPVLEKLAAEVGETCFLVAARAGALIVLEKAEGTGFLRAAPQVGASVPVHATAVGKLHLALAPDSLAGGPDDDLESFTAQTVTDPAALDRAIEAVRAAGLAWSLDEWIAGLSVLAAPIRVGERLAAAIALALPSPALASHDVAHLEDRVREAAAEISGRLTGGAART